MARIKIKTKLFLGFGFLFVMIVLLSLFSTFYIYNFSARSSAMLKENYQSIEIAKYMSQTLHEIRNMQTTYFFSTKNFLDDTLYARKNRQFEKYIVDEENNITEIGERNAALELQKSYETYIGLFQNPQRIASQASGDDDEQEPSEGLAADERNRAGGRGGGPARADGKLEGQPADDDVNQSPHYISQAGEPLYPGIGSGLLGLIQCGFLNLFGRT